MTQDHRASILYFGTPVVLISTRNEDGTTNVAPMSSAWFLGWGSMIGLAYHSKTPEISCASRNASSIYRPLRRWTR